MQKENKTTLKRILANAGVYEHMVKTVKYASFIWAGAVTTATMFYAYYAIRRGIPEEIRLIKENKKTQDIENMVVEHEEKELYSKILVEPTEEEMKRLKYTVYKIEKERAISKAAQEVDKKFLNKSYDDI